MPVEPELLEWFTDTVTVTPKSSKDLYGRESYSDADSREVACFIERSPRLVQDTEGREVMSSATIYMDDTSISATDRVLYADGTRAIIVSIFIPRDQYGPHHSEVSVT